MAAGRGEGLGLASLGGAFRFVDDAAGESGRHAGESGRRFPAFAVSAIPGRGSGLRVEFDPVSGSVLRAGEGPQGPPSGAVGREEQVFP